MMATFNPITYANKLKDAGMAARIADVHSEEMVNLINQNLATKSDLRNLELELKAFVVKTMMMLAGFIVTVQTIASYMAN